MLEIIAYIFIVIGVVALAIGTIGLWRLPDIFSRLHAAGLVDSVALPFLLLGLALVAADLLVLGKTMALLVFALITSATACHALARAALADTAPSYKIIDRPAVKTVKKKKSTRSRRG
ncbi:MAG: sodium:proton antiporter [Alphaproteobacteria bacterium]|nr:sodium:proton antiporter [Alphaproteobacteria bacterium]